MNRAGIVQFMRYRSEYREQMLALHRSAIEGIVLGMSQQQDEADLMAVEDVYLRNRGEFLLGFTGEQLVAMGGFKRLSDHVAELRRMRIARELQGRGYGTLLLRELERRAFQSGIRTLCMDTARRRPLTLEFYRQHGYEEIGQSFYGAVETVQFKKTLDERASDDAACIIPLTTAMLSDRVAFSPVTASDFDELVTLRIAAMRDSLERLGRFDPERARERLQKSFYPEQTEFILLDGQRVGFYTFRPAEDGFHLDHLYVTPAHQSCGVGSYVLRRLLSQSDRRQMPVRLGALRNSPSNRFYQRHGFVQTAEDEWDIYYVRMSLSNESGNT